MDGGGGAGYGAGGGGGSGFVWTQETSKNAPSRYSVPTKYYLNNASTRTGQRTGDGSARITLIEGTREVTETVTEETTSTTWKTIQGIIEEGILTGNFLWNGHTITVTDTNGETVVYGGKSDDIPTERPIPIPDGYVASQVEGENTKEDGLVIYEGTDPVTAENHATAMSSRNQYVWIPVDDINDMVMCSSNSGDSVCDLIYNEEANTLTCQTHPGAATELVGRLYTGASSNTTDDDGNIIYSYTMDFTKRDQTYNTSSCHEPNTVSSDASNGLELSQLESDFTAMAKSVAKNGGFYISRYEVGANGDSKKNQQVLTAAISNGTNYLGANKWYGLYNTLRENNRPMIWGCQYDQVIKFLKENGEDPENGHSDRNLTIAHALSGQNELDKMKNIYDLEGNHAEWTAEANSHNNRAPRGSSYNNAYLGYFYPAGARYNNYPPFSYSSSSSRSTLYL